MADDEFWNGSAPRLRAMAHAIRHAQQGEIALMNCANGRTAVVLTIQKCSATMLTSRIGSRHRPHHVNVSAHSFRTKGTPISRSQPSTETDVQRSRARIRERDRLSASPVRMCIEKAFCPSAT
ncbi:hypothetical protein H8B02_11915 [Bradyrhizobium sp. Pear77]|nr:hypothetical protein [Bradyrhizobium altum]